MNPDVPFLPMNLDVPFLLMTKYFAPLHTCWDLGALQD